MVANVQTPYRVHVHLRIAREVPAVRLASLYTHDQPDQPWETKEVAEINPVWFGAGHPVVEQGRLKYWKRDWDKGGRIIRWLKEKRARMVLVGGYNDLTRLRLIRWCRGAGVPCFIMADSNIHGDLATGLRRVVKRLLVTRVVGWATGVMPFGSLGAAYFKRYGASADRIIYLPFEPDYDQIAGVAQDAIDAAVARFGMTKGRRRILVCSRLMKHKRVDLAVDAFKAVAAARPEWDMVVVGDGPERAALQARVGPELGSRVQWTGFIGEQAVVSAIYRACDVLVHPAEYEPWALVINEAAGAGLAIVATEVVGAAAELVREGVNGHLARAGDLGSLTEAVRLATEPGRVDALRAGSAGVLADWRGRGDPVEGFRKALRVAGVAGGAA